jgi:hypothetical protein
MEKFSDNQSNILKEFLLSSGQIEKFIKSSWSDNRIKEIAMILEGGLDIELALKHEYSDEQLRLIREILIYVEDSDTIEYIDASYTTDQLTIILRGIKQGINIGPFISSKFHWTQMEQVLLALKDRTYDKQIEYDKLCWLVIEQVRHCKRDNIQLDFVSLYKLSTRKAMEYITTERLKYHRIDVA